MDAREGGRGHRNGHGVKLYEEGSKKLYMRARAEQRGHRHGMGSDGTHTEAAGEGTGGAGVGEIGNKRAYGRNVAPEVAGLGWRWRWRGGEGQR